MDGFPDILDTIYNLSRKLWNLRLRYNQNILDYSVVLLIFFLQFRFSTHFDYTRLTMIFKKNCIITPIYILFK